MIFLNAMSFSPLFSDCIGLLHRFHGSFSCLTVFDRQAALLFVPRCLLDIFGQDDLRTINLGSTVSLVCTIVCLDFKGFTQWAENRLLAEIIVRTNEAWSALTPNVHKSKGAVVIFTGDGLILLFPHSPLDALHLLFLP